MATTRRRRQRKSGVGTALYVILLALWVIGLFAVGLYAISQVWAYAKVYDDTQEEPVIEAYVNNLRNNLWDESIGSTVAAMPHPVQTDAEVIAVVKDILQGEIGYQLDPTRTRSDSLTYYLMAGESAFGTVTLVQDTSRNLVENVNIPSPVLAVFAKMGVAIQPELYSWRVSEEHFDFTGLYTSIRATVPSSYYVALNGTVLGPEYIVETDIMYDNLESYYYRYENFPTKVTYEFDQIIGRMEPVIYDDTGTLFIIDPNQDDSQFLKEVTDPAVLEKLANHIDGFSNAYLRLSASIDGVDPSGPYSEVLNYIEPGSELDEKLKQVMLIGSWSHNSFYEYRGSELLNAHSIGPNFYVVEFNCSASVSQPAGWIELTRTMRAIIDDTGSRTITGAIDDI